MGEFGIDPDGTRGLEYLELQTDLHDEFGASDAFWVWKEDSQDSWGLYDHIDGEWVERPTVRRIVSRPMPHRIAGQPRWWKLDRTSQVLQVAFEGSPEVSAPNEIYLPAPEDYAEGFVARCDGSVVEATRSGTTGVVEIPCSGRGPHLLEVAPNPPR